MTSEYPPRRANILLGMLMVAYLLSFIDRQILSLLVAPIRADLGISDFKLSLLQGTSFGLFYVTLGLPLGWLVDRYRRLSVAGAGCIVWSGMTMACGLAQSFGSLFAARVGVGAGEAALSPSAYSLLADSFPAKRLARVMGIYTAALSIGGGLAYIIGGWVVSAVSDAPPVAWPLLGVIKPWQQVFVIVGLPGTLVGILIILLREPPRHDRTSASEREDLPGITDGVRHLLRNWATYRSIILSNMLLSIAGYAMLNWYPSFLMRSYQLPVAQAGLIMGLLYLLAGTAGTLGAPLFAERLARRGHANANMRTVAIVGALLTPLVAIGPQMPGLVPTLIVAAPTIVLLNAFFGVSIAALQLATPNRLRGMLSALFLFTNNVAGLTIGSSLVPFLTDFLFRDDTMVGYSLTIVLVIACPLAAWTASLRPPAAEA